MARRAARQYPGRGLDLAILPETTATAASGSARQHAYSTACRESPGDVYALARKHKTYVLMALDMAEQGPKGTVYSNSAVLFDRQGKIAGIYRKVHPVAVVGTSELESGITPGRRLSRF